MMPRILLLLSLITILTLVSCGTPGNPSDPLGDFPTSTTADQFINTGEARVRYILADIQLSGLYDYYTGFPGDAEAMEAIRRWDQGIRVENIGSFERKMVGDNWVTAYYGTETVINGMDVILTEVGCNHPYYPIRVGASWTYDLLDMMGNVAGMETNEVTSVSSSGGDILFTLLTTDEGGSDENTFTCSAGGIRRPDGTLLLPPVGEMSLGNTWSLTAETSLQLVQFETISVPAGSFSTARLAVMPYGIVSHYWAEGVGLVQMCTERCKVLTGYYIP